MGTVASVVFFGGSIDHLNCSDYYIKLPLLEILICKKDLE
jgi:hypothetical protein